MTELDSQSSDGALWGLWGGLRPGGWASFETTSVDSVRRYSCAGTRDEAEAGKLAYEREQSEYRAKYSHYAIGDNVYTYTVLPFRSQPRAREP